MIPYKFKCSHWLKLQHSDWRANLVKYFFFNRFSTNESTRIITGHVIYNPAYTYKFQLKTTHKWLAQNSIQKGQICHNNLASLRSSLFIAMQCIEGLLPWNAIKCKQRPKLCTLCPEFSNLVQQFWTVSAFWKLFDDDLTSNF